MDPLPRQATSIARATLDRVAQTEPGTLWLLIPYAAVVALFAAAIPAKDPGAASFFAGVSALAIATFIWALVERRAAHRTLKRLQASQRLGQDQHEDTLRQYTVVVGFLALAATFKTHFYAHHRPLLATLITLLLGWWAFPWGPVRTVRTIVANLRGGTARSEAQLLAELKLRVPPSPPWWKHLLALDSRDPIRIASRLATLGMVVVVVLLVLTAFMRKMLVEAPSP